MTAYLTREALMAALTQLAETDFTHTTLAGTIRIREITAQQALDIRQAAGSGADFDAVLWHSLTAQAGVIDGPGGAPMLTVDDAAALGEGRNGLLLALANAIWALSEGAPGDLKKGSSG